MQYVFGVLLFLVVFTTDLAGQKDIFVTGKASTLMNDPQKTRPQYEIETLKRARENALEKAFGSSVESKYESLVITEMEGRSVSSTREVRNNYINTFPNGRWIRDENSSAVEERDDKGNWWMTCEVTGYAREVESAPVRFKAYTLDGHDPQKNIAQSFAHGEDGYLYFRSPDEGFLVVFYDDFNSVQRCIPYNVTTEKYLKVDSDRDYIFFSGGKNDYLSERNKADRIQFYTNTPRDFNLFYVLFSSKPFSGYNVNEPDTLPGDFRTFRWLHRDEFQDWLQEQRIRNKNLQVEILDVTITRND